MADGDALERVAALCARAGPLLFVTGAGISVDSGLPTYRGIGGLYEEDLTEDGLAIEEALSGLAFALRPDLTWKYLAQIEANCRGARPNAAHLAIAELERRHPGSLVFTQNVDGLHRAAGSRNLLEIHGTLHRLRCIECQRSRVVPDYAGLSLPPACPSCGGLLRPDVVLFGEELPADGMARLEEALLRGFDLVFSIGTTSVFPYVAGPVLWARQAGVPTVEINPGRSEVTHLVDFRLPMGAAQAMTSLMERIADS